MTNQLKHVLAVDDNGDVRDVLIAMLEGSGYRVTSADGGASMRAMLEREGTIDVVVLDATMPGERSTTLALHAKSSGLPVVMISGSPAAMEFAEMNGLQLLWKPFNVDALREAVEKAMSSGVAGQRDA